MPTSLTELINSLHELDQIEKVIVQKFDSKLPRLNDIANYLLGLGGKRIRPTLCLLAWKAFSKQAPSRQLLETAAGIELIHMATLLHDDIIDNSPLRRSKESPYKRYGLTDTLLTGDFLLTRAFGICARLDPYIVDATENAVTELIEGETMETLKPVTEFSLEESLTIARKKTAALFKLSCETSSFLLGGSAQVITELTKFGESLGIAFQILDDILDITSTEEVLGKKTGTDIKEKKPSYVNVLWLESGDKLAQQYFNSSAELTAEEIQSGITAVKASGAVEKAKLKAESYAFQAKKHLDTAVSLSGNSTAADVNNLAFLVDYTLERLN